MSKTADGAFSHFSGFDRLAESSKAYLDGTAGVERIPGPFNLRGAAGAQSADTERFRISSCRFPGLHVGGDGLGTDFVLILPLGRVITLHHDATYQEVARKTASGTAREHLASFAREGAPFDIADLLALQQALATRFPNATIAELSGSEAVLSELPGFLGSHVPQWFRARPFMAWFERRFGLSNGTLAKFEKLNKARFDLSWRALTVEEAARATHPVRRLLVQKPAELARLREFPDVTSVSVRKLRLRELPEELLGVPKLQALYADQNALVGLPDWVPQLTEVRELSLQENRITSLPDALGVMPNLEQLELYGNRLSALPAGIFESPRLFKLHVGGNPIGIPGPLPLQPRLESVYLPATLGPEARALARAAMPNASILFV